MAIISKLADDKGKIAALSEFGYSPTGMKVSGNGDLNWFTNILNEIKQIRVQRELLICLRGQILA